MTAPAGARAVDGHDEPHDEPHEAVGGRLNWLRAGVLGANDGIVSVAGIVLGVAAATADRTVILTAGVAGLTAGAMSMAVGEYVSVSTQRDTETALLSLEERELREQPEEELAELAGLYAAKGLPDDLAREVAAALTERDALAAHGEVELGIVPGELTNPWQAALASFVAFSVGALLPLVAVAVPSPSARVGVTVLAVVTALAVTGLLAGRLGSAPVGRPVARNVAGGLLAMGITYGIGTLVGFAV